MSVKCESIASTVYVREDVVVEAAQRPMNELEAAIGLLMLRYQPVFKLKGNSNVIAITAAPKTTTESTVDLVPTTLLQKQQKFKTPENIQIINTKEFKLNNLKKERKSWKPMTMTTSPYKLKQTSAAIVRKHNKSNTSLLSHCRNILKDFLDKNSLE
ncbi:hypothetical protein ACFFRR_004372 [Megaselia abdita]